MSTPENSGFDPNIDSAMSDLVAKQQALDATEAQLASNPGFLSSLRLRLEAHRQAADVHASEENAGMVTDLNLMLRGGCPPIDD